MLRHCRFDGALMVPFGREYRSVDPRQDPVMRFSLVSAAVDSVFSDDFNVRCVSVECARLSTPDILYRLPRHSSDYGSPRKIDYTFCLLGFMQKVMVRSGESITPTNMAALRVCEGRVLDVKARVESIRRNDLHGASATDDNTGADAAANGDLPLSPSKRGGRGGHKKRQSKRGKGNPKHWVYPTTDTVHTTYKFSPLPTDLSGQRRGSKSKRGAGAGDGTPARQGSSTLARPLRSSSSTANSAVQCQDGVGSASGP